MIRALKKEELPILFDLAKEFNDSSEFLNINNEIFKKNWEKFIDIGVGKIFIAEKDGKTIGTLGAIKHDDILNGELVSQEMFWFVSKKNRNGLTGIKLLRNYQQWAKDQGCKIIRIAHLADLMPEKLKRLYGRFDFKKMETYYTKRI